MRREGIGALVAGALFVWVCGASLHGDEPAPAGREDAMPLPAKGHFVSGRPLDVVPDGMEVLVFGMGCFWGAEKRLGAPAGVHVTAVGYAGGATKNPTYHEVCSGDTGHAEVVRVVYDPKVIAFAALLRTFWESHDPTQGMRQGNDHGTQYRSAIYTTTPAQREAALASKAAYEKALKAAGNGAITTEITDLGAFYFAEEGHQQYLAKHPDGYCGLGGTGVSCPSGADAEAAKQKP